MISRIKFGKKDIAFSDINLLPWGGRSVSVPYSCEVFHPECKTGILTRESAHLLLNLHPLALWGNKNYCVLGRRVLHLVSPHMYRDDQISVVYLPSASEDEVRLLMSLEPLLNQIAFATQGGGKGVFETSRKIDKSAVNFVSPILNQSIETLAKMFTDCSPSSLYKANTKK
jgi:hypothetical protein